VAGGQHTLPIARCTAEEARAVDVGSWFGEAFASERIPLLAEVLLRYRGRTHLHIELKSAQPELPAAVAAALRATGWLDDPGLKRPQRSDSCSRAEGDPDVTPVAASQTPAQPQVTSGGAATAAAAHTPSDSGTAGGGGGASDAFAVPGLTLTSFHLDQLRLSLELLPGVRHGWLVQRGDGQTLAAARQAGVHGVYPRANAATTEAIASALAAGFSARAWGVRDLELLRHVHACGAQGCTVNWPDVARRALASGFEGIEPPQLRLHD
jgi:hypothetical protein